MGKLANILREKELHPDIAIRVIDRFDHDFLDDAILNAYKVIEEKLRAIMGSFDSDAMELIKQAFHPNTGFLTDPRLWPSEKEGIHQLFRGAFLTYRDSSAHRYTLINPDEACDAIIILPIECIL
ncbi:MAG: TIGR02391 family protein [Oscillochloridaceae bacterium]|nr:TIGR02391 family protein [Chloroflexaceae bacterium]MDW8390991.1 TIGR02391 family protein [Oscillochloridaceae bacterium]